MEDVQRKKAKAIDIEESEPPEFHIANIEQNGFVKVAFTQEMMQVPNLTMINNGTYEKEGAIFPVLEVEILPGYYSVTENLNMTWNVTEQGPDYLHI